MNQDPGERWHCMSAACHKEIVVACGEAPAENRPRCTCGAEMKKEYSPPVFRYLEFLQLEQPLLAGPATRKD